jgi:hypothetical protein
MKTKKSMKKILYVNKKEIIELSYPTRLSIFMERIWPLLKVKTIKNKDGATIKLMCFNEASNLQIPPSK